ncbi:MAG TPA: NAD(P)/FAD-dependent oxidoreductase [Arthrobacter sp.]|nr:NAD(P)/FAD-dependent oxidoreductase [Arthrobacter sp.]
MESTPMGYPASGSPVDVIIVGTGFGGLGMGAKLAREGERSFIILERAEDVGGTWRDNHYPGAACDVPSLLYSFSFRPNPEWSRMFAPQEEILGYLRSVAREENLLERIVFGAELTDARWDEAEALWKVSTPKGEFAAKTLVTAVGHLSEPKMPDIEGLSDFSGEVFHSAQWNDGIDLAGKRVGIVGSGATAIQVLPEVAKIAGEVVVFQRSAPYVTPRPDRAYTEEEKGLFRKMPEVMQELREEMFWSNEERYAQRRGTPTLVSAAAQVALDHLHRQIEDPELRRKLTPDYTFGCKRVLKSSDYYPTFTQEHVHLETGGVTRVEGNRVIGGDGGSHELDVIIACTGFEATDLPIAYRIYGRDGQPLSERWANGMQAYATTAVHGFPNLWIINGPNTGLGHNSAVYIAEAQIDYIMGAVNFRDQAAVPALEVSREAEDAFMDRVDQLAQGTVWLDGGCSSWYVDHRNGRLTTLWPEPAYTFRQVNAPFDPDPYLAGSTDEAREEALAGVR